MNSFFQLYRQAFLKPGHAFSELLKHPNALSFGFFAVCVQAILYTGVYVFLIFGGGQAFKPWLYIPVDEYYKYNVFFCAPSMILAWILAAGLIFVLTRLGKLQGQFEYILALFGFGIGIASWSTGLHDISTSFLGAVHIIDQRTYEFQLNSPTIWRTLLWIQMLVYLCWFIFLFSLAINKIYHTNRWMSFVLGFVGFLTYQLFFLIFNR